jgi:hypothetical protein
MVETCWNKVSNWGSKWLALGWEKTSWNILEHRWWDIPYAAGWCLSQREFQLIPKNAIQCMICESTTLSRNGTANWATNHCTSKLIQFKVQLDSIWSLTVLKAFFLAILKVRPSAVNISRRMVHLSTSRQSWILAVIERTSQCYELTN